MESNEKEKGVKRKKTPKLNKRMACNGLCGVFNRCLSCRAALRLV